MGLFDVILRSDSKIRGGVKDKRKSDLEELKAKRAVANEEARQAQLERDRLIREESNRRHHQEIDRQRMDQIRDEEARIQRERDERNRGDY